MRLKALLPVLLVLPIGCKSAGSASQLRGLDEAVTPPKDCRTVTAVDSGVERTGAEIYTLTQNCIFNATLHNVEMKIGKETFANLLDLGCRDKSVILDGKKYDYARLESLTIDGHVIRDVGIKVRGNTSKCNLKRQFKFKFDETELYDYVDGKAVLVKTKNKDRRFFGLEGLSVRASANDPSTVREILSSEGASALSNEFAATERGAEVYRLSSTKLSVAFTDTQKTADNAPDSPKQGSESEEVQPTLDYKGIYSLAENLDKTFLISRYQKGDKALKDFTLVQADQAHGSFTRNYIADDAWATEYLKGKKVKTKEDHEGAIEEVLKLGDFLTKSPNEAEIEERVNVDSVLNYTAAAILNGHWDSLLSNANNDYLYHDGKRWHLITWDLDNTLGANIDQYRHFMSDDIFAPSREKRALIFTAILAPENKGFRQRLRERLKTGLEGPYSAQGFDDRLRARKEAVVAAAASWESLSESAFLELDRFVRERRERIGPQL